MVLIIDPVGDMLARIRNAALAGKKQVKMPASDLREGVARVLEREGFLEEVEVEKKEGGGKELSVDLVYEGKGPLLSGSMRVSRPGRRVYKGVGEMKSVVGGVGVLVVSTSKGVMSGKEAKKAKLGGEILAEVW